MGCIQLAFSLSLTQFLSLPKSWLSKICSCKSHNFQYYFWCDQSNSSSFLPAEHLLGSSPMVSSRLSNKPDPRRALNMRTNTLNYVWNQTLNDWINFQLFQVGMRKVFIQDPLTKQLVKYTGIQKVARELEKFVKYSSAAWFQRNSLTNVTINFTR